MKTEKGNFNSHPSVKPVQLMEHFINLFTMEGATILDPFAGSGTTLVACQNTNRNGIGIEISKDYCKIIEKILEFQPLF